MKFLQKVKCTGYLKRKTEKGKNNRYRVSGLHKVWREHDHKFEGVVIGKRTLSNGVLVWLGDGDGYGFEPKEHFPAYLVIDNMYENPVYVLESQIIKE